MAKRFATESLPGQPKSKVSRALLTPNIAPVTCQDDLDIKVLQQQNRMLTSRLKERLFREEELQKQLTECDNSRSRLQSTLSLVNRHWDQLDADVKILVQRVSPDHDSVFAIEDSSTHVSMFLQKLLKSHYQEDIEAATLKRYSVSKVLVARLVGAVETARKDAQDLVGKMTSSDDFDVNAELKDHNKQIGEENLKLSNSFAEVQAKYHEQKAEFDAIRDKLTIAEERVEELTTSLDDNQFDMQKASQRIERLEMKINELVVSKQQLQAQLEAQGLPLSGSQSQQPQQQQQQPQLQLQQYDRMNSQDLSKDDQLADELSEQKELAVSRLKELEAMQAKYEQVCQDLKKSEMQAGQVTDAMIHASIPYKSLQAQFSVLFSEYNQLKMVLEETRRLLTVNKTQYLQQLDEIEAEEQKFHHKSKSEVTKLSEALVQLKKEYQKLRMEHDHLLAATDQQGPIHKEMRRLIASLQSSNQQLKAEAARYKRKFQDAYHQLEKFRLEGRPVTRVGSDETCSGDDSEKGKKTTDDVESELVRELRASLRKAEECQKETKLLLDVYKGSAKDQREKVELLTTEKRLRAELEDLQIKLKDKNEQVKRLEGLADAGALQKLRRAEDSVKQMQKELSQSKQDEDAIMNEMEMTTQAFDEMQEQNARLLKQLQEKEDANLKLMSERIKQKQKNQLLMQQHKLQENHLASLESHVLAQTELMKKLEEKEKNLQSTVNAMEKEVALRQQAMDAHRKKAIEAAQSVQEVKMQFDKQSESVQELRRDIETKTSAVEQEEYKCRRIQEENHRLKTRLERHKKFGVSGSADEVLKEELRASKAKLTCPCCNTNKKDCVLTKCFHVFCIDCIKTRYETRQRKCPKCAAAFGANDFHKIYLS
ncbi:E3 ubiquitin-protein ligase BRE1B-like [Oscarella lobularis]|uniref:E3 ubiquitin-protein ligase BRE1B-like n=1 Tax=Oscarella lobularis TaxID=121494 RepID=UPI003313BC15